MLDTVVYPLAGGALIGIAAAMLWMLSGRIAGISGIVGGTIGVPRGDLGWRFTFIAGLLAGGALLALLRPSSFPLEVSADTPMLIAAGLLVGLGTALFVDYSSFDVTLILGFAVATALLFAFLGIVTGLWAERWDHYGAVEGFVIVPLGLLSGTFFSATRLPEGLRDWIYYNPVFYAVDGFRAGFLGQAETSLALGAVLVAALTLGLGAVAWRLFAAGYKIRP